MSEALVQKLQGVLVLCEEQDPALFANIPNGTEFVIDVPQKFSKSRAQEHFFFGILTRVWNNIPEKISNVYKERDDFRYAMTYSLGYNDEFPTKAGVAIRPRSVKKMEHSEFNDFVNDALDFYVRIGFGKYDLIEAGMNALHPVDKLDGFEVRE